MSDDRNHEPETGFFAEIPVGPDGEHRVRLERDANGTGLIICDPSSDTMRLTLADGDIKKLQALFARFDLLWERAGHD